MGTSHLPYDTDDCCDNYRGITAIVFGATGFIGRWVAKYLCQCGARAYLVARDPLSARSIFDSYGISGDIVKLDLLSDVDEFLSLYHSIRPDITFNLAGYGVDRNERDENTAYMLNAGLIHKLCISIAEVGNNAWNGQDLIHVGSALEYGVASGNLSENSSPRPTTLYGQTKLAGTRALTGYVNSGALKGITARLFTVYGPGEHEGRLLPSLLEASRTGQALSLTQGTQKRDFTYVADVAEGLLRLGRVRHSQETVCNLATGNLFRVREFIETASDVLAIPREKLEFGAIPIRNEEMEHDPVSTARLREMVNWVPGTNIETGVRLTRDFFSACSS